MNCPYLRQAEKVLDRNEVRFLCVELDEVPNGGHIWAELKRITNKEHACECNLQGPLPYVFIGG